MPFAATWMDLEIIMLSEVSPWRTDLWLPRRRGGLGLGEEWSGSVGLADANYYI